MRTWNQNHKSTNRTIGTIVIYPNDHYNTQQRVNQGNHKNSKDTIVHHGEKHSNKGRNYIYFNNIYRVTCSHDLEHVLQ